MAFAEVERFLDTPVKHFSSGMYVRLAFAVAAHLEPEILIVDEVLAVGDAAFQKKSLGKMREVSGRQGRTVLFVSHNMAAVEALCSRVLLLESGRLVQHGSSSEVVKRYLRNMMSGTADLRRGANAKFIKSLRITDRNGDASTAFQIGDSVFFDVELFSEERLECPRLGIAFYTHSGVRVATLNSDIQQSEDWSFSGRTRLRAVWNNIPINTGEYRIDLSLWSGIGEIETLTGCASLNVCAKDVYGTGRLPEPTAQGYLVPDASWQLNSQALPDETVRFACPQDEIDLSRIGKPLTTPQNNCLILGAGRSGTSLTAFLLERAGYHVYKTTYPPDEGNPLGYFEDFDVVNTNEAILGPIYRSTWRQFSRAIKRKPNVAGTGAWLLDLDPRLLKAVSLRSKEAQKFRELFAHPTFAYKDPRFSFTLGVLAPLLPKDTLYICVFRNPLPVVKSTRQQALRSGVVVDDRYCFRLWEMHYRCLLEHYRQIGGRWLFVSYEQMINGEAIPRMEGYLNVQLDRALVKQELNRSQAYGILTGRVAQLFDQLMELEKASTVTKLCKVGSEPRLSLQQ